MALVLTAGSGGFISFSTTKMRLQDIFTSIIDGSSKATTNPTTRTSARAGPKSDYSQESWSAISVGMSAGTGRSPAGPAPGRDRSRNELEAFFLGVLPD